MGRFEGEVMSETKSYGQVAYEAFQKSRGTLRYPWESLTTEHRTAWGAAGLAVASVFFDDYLSANAKEIPLE
jgi:hypothetical protein